MEDIINHKGFSIFDKLQIKGRPTASKQNPPALTGSEKEHPRVNLSSKIGREGICRAVTEYYGLTELNDIYYYDEKSEIRLTKEGFTEFQSLVSLVLSIPTISSVVSKSFVEDAIYYWMIEILHTRSDKKLLFDYIKSKMDEEVKEYEFFYPMMNLVLDEPFRLGNTDFTYFTEEYLDELYNHYKTGPNPKNKEQFDSIFRVDYQGKVLVKVTVFAEDDKAKELASRYVELIVDVLKIMVLGTHYTDLVNTFELSHRLNFQIRNKYLLKGKASRYGYALGVTFKNKESYHLTKAHLEKCKQNGLLSLVSFVSINNTDELYTRLISAIELYSFSLSIPDLHRRIISLITIIESLVIEDDKEYGMEKKVKERCLKIFPNSNEDINYINNILPYIYKIRHKMVHKAIRLPIDYAKLNDSQVFLIRLLLNLTNRNIKDKISDKAGLFKTLDN